MIALNLIALLLVSIIFISFFRNRYVKIALSVLFGIFFCLEVSSLYLGNSFIDYKYYLHFNVNALSMSGGFKTELFLFFLLWAGISFLLFFASKFNLFKKKRLDSIVKISFFVVSISILLFSKNGVYDKLEEINDIAFASVDEDFDKFVREQGLDFTKKEDLEASFGGKNIIILSLESFEKAFLHDVNRELTPNLRKRKEAWTFYEMKSNQGSGWTAGSLYTVFTGLPSFFIGHPNFYFEGATEDKLISLGDILNRCGYESYHLSNDASFAGTKDILNVFGINNVLDGTFGGKYTESPLSGAYDKDIFKEAKEILSERKSKKPFMLFIATTQTHCPDGWVDDRMLQFIERKNTDLETAAVSTDWLVEDFISFLKKNNILENTVIYLFPDHTFMGGKNIFKNTKENRGLWFMTNADKNDLHIDPSNFYQIDILPNILSGAKIKHNVRFLSDFIQKDKDEFIRENKEILTALNTSAIIRDRTIGENLYLGLKGNKLLCIANRERLFAYNVSSLKDNNVVLFLNKELKVLSEKVISDKDLNDGFYDYYYTYIKISPENGKLNFEWVRDDVQKYTIADTSEIKLDKSQIISILKSITYDEGDNVNTDIADNIAPTTVEYAPEIKDSLFTGYLPEALKDSSKIILISCYDEGSIYFEKLSPVMKSMNLKESLAGKFRWSYLSVFSNRKVYCEKAAENTVLYKKLFINDTPVSLTSVGMNALEKNSAPSSGIIIDNKKYTFNKRGLNVVVFDEKEQKVVDAFNVDTHEDENLRINRY